MDKFHNNARANQLELEKQNILVRIQSITEALSDFIPQGDPIPLSGGLLNFVWRVNGRSGSSPESLIAKWAPPVIASSPGVQLDPHRILIEAKVLEAFSQDGIFAELATNKVRPPHFIKLDSSRHVLLMEDVCQCPALGQWIQSPHDKEDAKMIGTSLGEFVGQLHRFTSWHLEFRSAFNNQTIQQTRLDVQFSKISDYAKKAGLTDADQIGCTTLAFGELLQKPGKVLIMGDLWLPSIFVMGDELRIIDWELAHYGRPSQDIGHLAAHLWMYHHRHPGSHAAKNARIILEAFLLAYRVALGECFVPVFGEEGIRQSAIHFGSEVLTRTVGRFQSEYLYDGMNWDHPLVQEGAAIAANHILEP